MLKLLESTCHRVVVSAKIGVHRLIGFFLLAMPGFALASPSGTSGTSGSTQGVSIGGIANNINNSVSGVQLLVQGGAFLIGVCLVVAGLLKLKAHKENPQQTPLGLAMVFLVVGALLTAIPSVLLTLQYTVWNGQQNTAPIQYQYGSGTTGTTGTTN